MTLVDALMERDGVSRVDAEETVLFMQKRVRDGEDPEEVLHDEGFEPDYIFEIL